MRSRLDPQRATDYFMLITDFQPHADELVKQAKAGSIR